MWAPAALGLVGEVDADMMKALSTHGLDPSDPATASRETWGAAARFGNAPRNYKNAEEIYAGLLDAHPEAGPEERAQLRAQAARSARRSVAFYDVVLSAPKSMTPCGWRANAPPPTQPRWATSTLRLSGSGAPGSWRRACWSGMFARLRLLMFRRWRAPVALTTGVCPRASA
jgi:TrwC relaxase